MLVKLDGVGDGVGLVRVRRGGFVRSKIIFFFATPLFLMQNSNESGEWRSKIIFFLARTPFLIQNINESGDPLYSRCTAAV